jgi:hypothetical protein
MCAEQQIAVLPMPPGMAIGDKFAQLTVLARDSNDAAGNIRLRCRCKCGRECSVRRGDLLSGHTKSCGCLRAIVIGRCHRRIRFRQFGTLGVLAKADSVPGVKGPTKWLAVCGLCGGFMWATTRQLRQGKRHCPCLEGTYTSWRNMKQRCTNENHDEYHRYGGRGIYVCPEWRSSFQRFVEDMGKRPEGKTLDRYPDPDGPYTPTNCRWATPEQQVQNRPKRQRLSSLSSCSIAMPPDLRQTLSPAFPLSEISL